ncbi:PstS family phosphate ABC transporter substrate-binding protein [Rudaea sp.]|uniref:PstS family phosphate ABC transporter substrate-binding protein n=1 Tax=Rudaea sp. TaxID=2136325 RepID=UPI002ECFE901
MKHCHRPFPRSLVRCALAAALIACGIGAASAADAPATAATVAATPTQFVEWVDQPRATAKPQTEEEAEAGKKNGRALPELELLQPTLDTALPAYKPRKDLKLAGTFKGAASDVLPGLANAWFAAFKKLYPNVNLSVAPPYAGSLGAKELVKQNIDFVFVSRELKPDDITDFKAKFGYAPTSVPISGGSYRHFGFLDAVGFFVSRDNPLDKISFAQLDAIFSSTHHRGGKPITTWGQLGLTGEWADKPIHAYGIKPWNGFEEFVRQRVLSTDGKRGEWNDGAHYDKLVFPMAKHGVEDRYAIGYTGIAYVDSPVKMLALGENESGPFVAPSYENVARAKYPLSRLIFFNVNKAPGKALDPALTEFLRFVLSREGQQIVRDQALYLPLRASQAEKARALLEP